MEIVIQPSCADELQEVPLISLFTLHQHPNSTAPHPSPPPKSPPSNPPLSPTHSRTLLQIIPTNPIILLHCIPITPGRWVVKETIMARHRHQRNDLAFGRTPGLGGGGGGTTGGLGIVISATHALLASSFVHTAFASRHFFAEAALLPGLQGGPTEPSFCMGVGVGVRRRRERRERRLVFLSPGQTGGGVASGLHCAAARWAISPGVKIRYEGGLSRRSRICSVPLWKGSSLPASPIEGWSGARATGLPRVGERSLNFHSQK